VYLTLNVLAFRAVRSAGVGYDSAETRHPYSGLEPPISLLLPAFDEELTIAASVTSLLQLFYSEFEVIVISDGSRDGTLAAMTRAFDCSPRRIRCPVPSPTALVRSVYTSRQFPNLRVIDSPRRQSRCPQCRRNAGVIRCSARSLPIQSSSATA